MLFALCVRWSHQTSTSLLSSSRARSRVVSFSLFFFLGGFPPFSFFCAAARHEMCWLRSGAAAYLPTKQTRPKRPSLNQKQGIRLADWAELLGVGYPVASCLNLLCFSWNLARVARGVYSFTNTTNGLPGGQARRKSRATRGPNCEPGFGPEINLNLDIALSR